MRTVPNDTVAHTGGALQAAAGLQAPLEPARLATIAPAKTALDGDHFGLFASQPWRDVLTAAYGFNIMASSLGAGTGTSAAILFAEIDDILGPRLVSLPFSDYLDPLSSSREDWDRIIAPLLSAGVPIRMRTLRNPIPRGDRRFASEVAGLWHAADLCRPLAAMWDSLGGSAKRNVRKAEGSGVTVREARSIDDLLSFYRLHSGLRKRKYNLFAQPFSFFEHLHAAFAEDDRILVLMAEQDGASIAGVLLLICGDTLYYKFNASSNASLRPNDLLIWHSMRVGHERGLVRLDFGLSDLDQPGLIRFKRKFATVERSITELRWRPPGYVDRRAVEAGRFLNELTAILTATDVPDEVTRKAGDEVYRYFC